MRAVSIKQHSEESPDSQAGSEVRVYHFLGFELDLAMMELRSGGAPVSLSPQSFAFLALLVRERERTVSQAELLDEVWGGTVVSAGALRQAVWELRKVLGDGSSESVIKTLRGRGYRFVAEVECDPVRPSCPLPAFAPQRTLFGRSRELGTLELALGGALSSSGRACILLGPAGVGKSRLARELVDDARARGVRCLENPAERDGSLPPLWPWLQLLEACLEGADAAAVARCCALAPELFAWLQGGGEILPPPLSDEPSQRRFRIFEQLARALAALSRERPLVFLLEDLHWADEASLAFLAHYARLLAQSRMLLLATCRPLESRANRPLARALEALSRGPHNERIVLQNLSVPEVQQLLEAQPSRSTPPALAEQVHALTQGNPLFALELARLLGDRKSPLALAVDPEAPSAQYAWLSSGHVELRAVIARRIESLPEACLGVIHAASVLGGDFSLAELAAALALTPEATLERVDDCLALGALVEPREGRLGFTHPLIREVAYGLVPRAERCRLHASVGAWLEALGADATLRRLNELAYHFYEAAPQGNAHKALSYARRAGTQALAGAAFISAARHFERALHCADLIPGYDPLERLTLELERTEAQAASGPSEKTRAVFLELAERALTLSCPTLHARALLAYTGHQHLRFVPARVAVSLDRGEVALLERALSGLGSEPSELRVLVLCSLAYALVGGLETARYHGLVREALAHARALQQPALEARVLGIHILVCASPQNLAGTLSACDAMVELTQQHGLRELELEARLARYLFLFCRVSPAPAQRDAERAVQLAEELDEPRARVRAELPRLIEAMGRGDLAEIERLSQRAYEAAPNDPNQQMLFMARTAQLLTMRTEAVRPDAALMYESFLASNPEATGVRAVLSSVYATLGRNEAALREFDLVVRADFAMIPEDMNWLSIMVMLTDAAVRVGDPVRSRLVYERLLPNAQEFLFFGIEAGPGGAVSLCLAMLATVMGEYAAAETWFERARVVHSELGMHLPAQWWAIARARFLLLARPDGGVREARALMRGVLEYAQVHGTLWLRQGIAALEAQFPQLGMGPRRLPEARALREG